MEHPLIGDLSNLSIDELGQKVNELQTKFTIAQRSGNGYLTNQVRMALESYYSAYQTKLKENQSQIGNVDFGDKIQIK